MWTEEQGKQLVTLARKAIEEELGVCAQPTHMPTEAAPDAWMLTPAATFVTLHRKGRLHGCIGSLEARRNLYNDVKQNAIAAAFQDPRATPLSADRLHELHVEVSVLSPMEELTFANEQDALSQLRPHVDGLVFWSGNARATFLPQVWESLPDPRTFLGQLKEKAGFASSYWSPKVRLQRYTVQYFQEPSPHASAGKSKS